MNFFIISFWIHIGDESVISLFSKHLVFKNNFHLQGQGV
jgi:hypothetical protein